MGRAHFFDFLKRIAEAREVRPFGRGQYEEANSGGENKAALLNGRVGSCPENRDRSRDL
jgi:hypothetical protein